MSTAWLQPGDVASTSARHCTAGGSVERALPTWAVWLPPLIFLAAAVAIWIISPQGHAESTVIFTTLSALFCGATSLVIAYLAAGSYAATGDRVMPVLGGGSLTFGVLCLLVGALLEHDLNVALVFFNTGLVLAGVLFLLAGILALQTRGSASSPAHGKLSAGIVYLGLAVVLGLLLGAALAGLLPAFYVPGSGVTRARELVLGVAVLEFLLASACLGGAYIRSGSRFARWYSPALAMIGLGLGTVWLGTPGSVISWTGRAGQFIGGLYMLVAILAETRASGSWTIRLRSELVENREQYRRLFETMTQGVVYQAADGRIISANPAAERILGLSLDQMRGRTSIDPRWRALREDGSDFPGDEHPSMVALRSGHEVLDMMMGVFNLQIEEYTWIRVDAVPLFSPGETAPSGTYTTFTDVTAIKTADDALRASETRYRTLFESMSEGFALHEMVYDDAGRPVDYRFLEANAAFGLLTGLDVTAITGRTVREVLPGVEPAWIEMYGRVVRSGQSEQFEMEAADLGCWYEGRTYPIGCNRFAVVFDDVTQRRRAEYTLRTSQRRSDLLARTAGALLSTNDLEHAVEALCRQVMLELDCQVFLNFLADDASGRLRLSACAGIEREEARRIESSLGYGVGVPGCIGRDAQHVTAEEIFATPEPCIDLLKSYGVQAYACHPLTSQGRVLGTLSFGTRTRRQFADDELAFMRAVAGHMALAFERRRSEETAQAELEMTQLLLEAARALGSLTELQRTLDTLAEIVLRSVRHSRVTASLWDPASRELRSVVSAGEHAVVETVLRRDDISLPERELLADPHTALADFEGLDPGSRETAVRQDSRLVLLTPLLRGERLIGIVSVDEPGERLDFSPREVEIVEGITALAAVAIEDAELFEEQKRIATTLQQHFIHPTPTIDGLEIAVVAEPASSPELVGGDFHDVFQLPHGLVAVLLGDVEGKGVRAAGLSETVRSAVRALAIVSPSPPYVLNNVNRMLLQQDGEQFVTAMLVIIDPVRGTSMIASAGHPPAIRLREGNASPIDTMFGPPLGTFDWDYEQTTFTLAAGDTLLIFTDGVSEARHNGELFGETGVMTVAAGHNGAAPREVAEAVRDAAVAFAGMLRDDLHLVALRFLGTEAGRSAPPRLHLAVPNAPWRLMDIRATARDFLAAHGVSDREVEDLVLCMEEACTNALRHSGSLEPTEVMLSVGERHVEISVQDRGRGFDTASLDLERLPDTLAPGGRGLYLINTLADKLEIHSEGGTRLRILKRRSSTDP